MDTIRVLIVEDEGLYRGMLEATFSSQADIEVVGSASNGVDAILMAKALSPHVVVMDIELGSEPNGIEAGKVIKGNPPYPGIVILSNHKDRQYVANLPLEQASGWSYLLKGSVEDTEILMRAVRGATWGLMIVDKGVIEQLGSGPGTALDRLTEMQREIMALVAQGYTDAEIGQNLDLEESHAKEEVMGLFKELGLMEEEPAVARVKAVLHYLQEARVE